MSENKVLIKTNGVVIQKTYAKNEKQDFLYYYVYYNSKPINGLYEVYTNREHFGENRIIEQAKTLEEAIMVAKSINDAIRLLAGYYDESFVLNSKFPVKINT